MNHVMLYIEDDDNNISLVKALLKRRPHVDLQVATNGRDGIQAATARKPALILLAQVRALVGGQRVSGMAQM
jgi:CheY-like chemotaxis protein